MDTAVRKATALLAEIRTLAGLHFLGTVHVVTTDRMGHVDGAWHRSDSGTLSALARAGHHHHGDQQAASLALAIARYATHPDREFARVLAPDPRFPELREVGLAHAPKVTVCPQCGANDGDGPLPLDGMLSRCEDPEGVTWQCLNPTCQWMGVEGEDGIE